MLFNGKTAKVETAKLKPKRENELVFRFAVFTFSVLPL
jgi:hypothetical protein